MRYKSKNQYYLALILFTVGILLLLINIGVISLEIKEIIVVSFPYVIFFIGCKYLLSIIWEKSSFQLLLGMFLTLYGGLLIGDHFNWLEFRAGDIGKLWPIFLIFLGIRSLVFKKKLRVRILKNEIMNDPKSKDNKDCNFKNDPKSKKVRAFSIGDVSFKKANWELKPTEMFNSVGDYYFDFSKAYIPDTETPIKVKGWIGDVKMIVPEDLPVKIYTDVKIGDIKIFNLKSSEINSNLSYVSPDYDEATRKLLITIELGVGSVRIDGV